MRWMCGRGQQLLAGEEGKAKRRLWEVRREGHVSSAEAAEDQRFCGVWAR